MPSQKSPPGKRTIAACPPSPGGINPLHLKSWFKVDNYTSGSTTWDNSVSNPNLDALTSITAPIYEAANSRWNYNPSLRFTAPTGNDNFSKTINSVEVVLAIDQGTLIGVGTFDGAENNSSDGFCGYYGDYGNKEEEFTIQKHGTWYRANQQQGTWVSNVVDMDNNPSINTSHYYTTAPASLEVFRNSLNNTTSPINNTVEFVDAGPRKFAIGEVPFNYNDYEGSAAEVISIAKKITSAEEIERNPILQ